MLAGLSAGNGLGTAAIICMETVSVIKLFGIQNLNFVIGIEYFVCGCGILIGPAIFGYILEACHHHYMVSMFIAGGIYSTGFLLAILSYILSSKSKVREKGQCQNDLSQSTTHYEISHN